MFVLTNSANEIELANSPKESLLYKIYHKQIIDSDEAKVNEVHEIIPKLQNEENSIYFGLDGDIYDLENVVQEADVIEAASAYVGFGLQKNSELLDLINYHLIKYMQAGIQEKVLSEWTREPQELESVMEVTELDYFNLIFPSMVLVLGISLSLLIGGLEKILDKLILFGHNEVLVKDGGQP